MPRTKEEYNAYMREYMIKRYHSRRNDFIVQLGGCCAQCKSTDSLEIDHIDRSKKTMKVERMCFVSLEKAQKELVNCQLLCRKCHEQKSISDLGNMPRRHGSLVMYVVGKCRCDLCKESNRVYKLENKRKKVRSATT